MAEFVTVMKEFDRMCSNRCKACPFSEKANLSACDCEYYVIERPKEAEHLIMQWAAEHPQKTMLQRFKELFPHAQLAHDGTPVLCLRDLGWVVQKPESINRRWKQLAEWADKKGE